MKKLSSAEFAALPKGTRFRLLSLEFAANNESWWLSSEGAVYMKWVSEFGVTIHDSMPSHYGKNSYSFNRGFNGGVIVYCDSTGSTAGWLCVYKAHLIPWKKEDKRVNVDYRRSRRHRTDAGNCR